MNKIMITLLTVVAAMAGELSNTTPLSAQPNWLTKSKKTSVTLELIKPNFDGDADLTLATTVLFLSARGPVSETTRIVVEFPIAHVGFVKLNDLVEETLLGNPYFGFEFGLSDSPTFFELGLRLPLAPDDKEFASSIGILSDFERLEAFDPDLLMFTGKVNYQQRYASNIVFRLRVGPSLWVFGSDEEDDPEDEIWLDYSTQVGYESDSFSVLGGLTGSYWVTQGDDDLIDRTVHQLGVAASLVYGKLRPGVHFRLPLNSGDDAILAGLDFVFGLSLGVQFD